MDTKSPEDTDYTDSPSIRQEDGAVSPRWKDILAELKYMLTTKDGWIGDYVRYSELTSHFSSESADKARTTCTW